MGEWAFLMHVGGWVGAGLVLLLMGWAAIERARLRRQWLRLPRELDVRRTPFDWCVATSMLAGCA